ncbi:MAG: hypothetical protein QXW94_02940 [Desulfurococcaceae archaeon]
MEPPRGRMVKAERCALSQPPRLRASALPLKPLEHPLYSSKAFLQDSIGLRRLLVVFGKKLIKVPLFKRIEP